MFKQKLEWQIDLLLFVLVVFDVLVSAVAFIWPELWFQVIHGVAYNDPQGFLRRCGANWAAFALFQGIALFRWKKAFHWLALAAGVRFTDVFTDWTYLWFSSDITLFGSVALLVASPTNVVLGWWLLKVYSQVNAIATESRG